MSRSSDAMSQAGFWLRWGVGLILGIGLALGASVVLMAERPTPDAVFRRWTGDTPAQGPALRPSVFFGAPTGYAGMLASPRLPARGEVALRLCSSAGEALPVLRSSLEESQPEVARAAILALSEWLTPEPMEDLLAVARSASNPAHSRASCATSRAS